MTFAHLIGGAYAMWKVTTETTRVFCKHSFGRNWGKLRTLLSVSQTEKNIMYNFHYLLLLFNLFWQSHFPQAIELFILFCGVLFLVPFIYNLPNVNSFMFPILKCITFELICHKAIRKHHFLLVFNSLHQKYSNIRDTEPWNCVLVNY